MPDNFIRQSQLITTYGPGAMIDLPDYSVIVSSLEDWAHLRREKIDEPRLISKLQRLLDVPSLELYTPPQHEEGADQRAPVGARIFPTWFIVKDAKPSGQNQQWRRRRLVRWAHLDRLRFVDEDRKRQPVVPVRFVCGCRRGHIDDLNWRVFVHRGGNPCERPLWLEERGTSGDISDCYGVCDCGEQRSLLDAFRPGMGALGQCMGRRPWIGQYASEECDEPYRLLVRTASNAYFPQMMNVISLPEFDAGLASKVTANYDRLKTLDDVGALANFRMSAELNAPFDGIDDAEIIAEYFRQKGGGEDDEVPVKIAEFQILNKGDPQIGQDLPGSKFYGETLPRNAWEQGDNPLLDSVQHLMLVHRLREVASLLGFTRLESINPGIDGELDLDVARASLAETITWLPTIENRGEGIFASFKTQAIEDWLARPEVQIRRQALDSAYRLWARERRRTEDNFPRLPYVMLHSLAHMLMTTISLDCGYPASSLRERVYAGVDSYGVLIYTGSSDSEGTLGGLVEAGRRFPEHLARACLDNLLCSNDPVCAEHIPEASFEGRPLHGAACHGCLLISETSCEQRNDFLDRALVVPTVSVPGAAFFDTTLLDP